MTCIPSPACYMPEHMYTAWGNCTFIAPRSEFLFCLEFFSLKKHDSWKLKVLDSLDGKGYIIFSVLLKGQHIESFYFSSSRGFWECVGRDLGDDLGNLSWTSSFPASKVTVYTTHACGNYSGNCYFLSRTLTMPMPSCPVITFLKICLFLQLEKFIITLFIM